MQKFGSIFSFIWLRNERLFHSQQHSHQKVIVVEIVAVAMEFVVVMHVVVLVVALRRLHDQCLQHQPPRFNYEYTGDKYHSRIDHAMADLTLDVKNLRRPSPLSKIHQFVFLLF